MKLKNKTILVTASTRGIGLSIVEKCAKEGATVYMAARNMERAETLSKKLRHKGYAVTPIFHDATKTETYAPMVAEVLSKSERIDVLVNNFGTSDPNLDRDIAGTSLDVFLHTLHANLTSVFLGSQAVINQMAAQGGGSIINISSVGGIVPDISQISYGTSKGAINYLTKLIAVQEAKNNIRCNAVLPGMTATEAVEQNLSESFRELFLRHIPLNRIGLPEEIAEAVCYFASDASAYTTGQILTVSGGFGLATPLYGDFVHNDIIR